MTAAASAQHLSKAVGKAEREASAAPARQRVATERAPIRSRQRSQQVVPANEAENDGAAGDSSTPSSGIASSRSMAPRTQAK